MPKAERFTKINDENTTSPYCLPVEEKEIKIMKLLEKMIGSSDHITISKEAARSFVDLLIELETQDFAQFEKIFNDLDQDRMSDVLAFEWRAKSSSQEVKVVRHNLLMLIIQQKNEHLAKLIHQKSEDFRFAGSCSGWTINEKFAPEWNPLVMAVRYEMWDLATQMINGPFARSTILQLEHMKDEGTIVHMLAKTSQFELFKKVREHFRPFASIETAKDQEGRTYRDILKLKQSEWLANN
jgi:hypothetical protein